ncbi:hypothetical protein [Streptomyces catenulae]|uniref:Uncharacterized protein n=1 Tax=Streptomyces catenulae TaxID=66875 RepID=A0ABV2Z7Q3_9ACTN|nr:hypothetical protein [Streptomyces catenulae]
MALHELCRDPESQTNQSPTLYYDDSTKTYLLQSWKVTDFERLLSIAVPEHETVVEFPARLLPLFPDGSAGDIRCVCHRKDRGEDGKSTSGA